ncbi:MAG: NAD-dependent epimerase/dehydratase family protein [Puniceicoccaceae bacterium]
MDSPSKTIAIAGASGFVGTSLRTALGHKYNWIGLTRSETVVEKAGPEETTWRRCDLFSLPQVRTALEGADLAIYMVHSMLPSSRLVQGNFRDMDLLLADNFIRAAEEAGVKRVIYIGGLIPTEEDESRLSPHLASRLEVERVLGCRSIPVTVLRAGLIFGPGGSSARMLLNLTRRLPFMLLPAWTRNRTQSVDIRDIVRAIDLCLESDTYTGTFDVAGHKPMSYGEMILRTSELLGRKTSYLSIPVNLVRLSRRWVSLFGSTPTYLVGPLLESLRHSLEAKSNPLLEAIMADAIPFDQSVRDSIDAAGRPLPNPRQTILKEDSEKLFRAKRVRSIQRMPLPDHWSAPKLSDTYASWISRFTLSFVQEDRNGDGILRFRLFGSRVVLLEFTPTPYSANCRYRRAYYITGGALSKTVDPPGRFELRIFPELGCLVTAIHGYNPRIPWWLYSVSQAYVHLAVMKAFSRFLRKLRDQIAKEASDGGTSGNCD